MQLFKSNKSANTEAVALNRKAKFKRGGYAVVITAAAIAAVILINVLFSALGNRVSLKFDLSFSGANSISEENIEFIKSIDKPVSITVCATKEDYSGGMMKLYAEQYLYVFDEGGYYEQTMKLIDLYSTYNPNITVEYLDLSGTAGSAVLNEYPSIFYGDLIVRYTDQTGNKKSKVVGFDDIYSYTDQTGYGYYSINGNKLETALSSAINTVISGNSKKSAILSKCSDSEMFETLFGSQLELNGFEVKEISDNIISSIPEDIDQLYIIYPSKDLLAEELNVINAWLNNNGNRGRSLIFVPGNGVSNIPNILEFLKEWGISYSNGVLYETNSSNHYPESPTILGAFNCETKLSGILDANKSYILGHNLPMSAVYETYSTKTTNTLIATSDSVVAAPLDIDEKWVPNDSFEKKVHPNLIITSDTDVVNDAAVSSYVAAFSSIDFIYSQWAQTPGLGNLEVAIKTATKTAGFDSDSQLLFIDKSINVESFADQITASNALIIRILFMIIVPLALIALGVIIWFRRRNK